ncbi:glycosyl hydrolase family 28-related protein [Corynebacterium sp. H127]|uniref:glycosyl hydrolase family 28-related protein n=1 Tax=Corynebacterium sp. H127 TaxID=3133418 RepID=UPI0030ABB584
MTTPIDSDTTPTREYHSVLDYGAVPDGTLNGGTDNSAAFEAAYDATPEGGIMYVPAGNYYLSRSLHLNKGIRFWCEWTSTAGGGRGASTLFFPPGVDGLVVGEYSTDTVTAHPNRGWEIGPFQLRSSSISSTGVRAPGSEGTSGVGILIKNGGKGRIHRPRVEGFGSHGIMGAAGGELKGQINHMSIWEPAACRNGGDGIHLTGTDCQRVTVYAPDVIGNLGWGINVDGANSNHIIAPHAAQQYYDSPGAFRDNAMSTYWEHVYSEGRIQMLFDAKSSYAVLLCSHYGKPELNFTGSGPQVSTMVIDPGEGFYGHVRINGRQTANLEMTMGVLSANTFALGIKDPTTSKNEYLLTANSEGTDMQVSRTLRPAASALDKDLGKTSAKWRDGHFSRYVRAAGAVQTGAYTSEARPAATVGAGTVIFDTTVNKLLVSTGIAWVDVMGNPV